MALSVTANTLFKYIDGKGLLKEEIGKNLIVYISD